MRGWGTFGMAVVLLALPAVAQGQQAPLRAPQSCTSEGRPDRLEGVTSQGDLVLEAGRLAKLSGIRLPEEGPWRDAALAWIRARSGREIVVQGRPERDRWARMTARLRPSGAPPAEDFGLGLLEAGLALVDHDGVEGPCLPDLSSSERKARELSLGLWSDDRYKPISSDDMDRLRARIGHFVLVEGRVRSIGERSQRIYLNFGEHWSEDFTIVIPRRTWKLMAERGLETAALKGRRIRARGVLEPWQGAALTIAVPEMIERLAGDRLPR